MTKGCVKKICQTRVIYSIHTVACHACDAKYTGGAKRVIGMDKMEHYAILKQNLLVVAKCIMHTGNSMDETMAPDKIGKRKIWSIQDFTCTLIDL